MPLPSTRDDDTREQSGRSSSAEHRGFLQAEVDKVLASTGARQVVTDAQTHHEFVVSPFPLFTTVLNLRPERVPDAGRNAPSRAFVTPPRGWLDPGRDKMAFDGPSPK